jgi:hydroxypyruvate reductase
LLPEGSGPETIDLSLYKHILVIAIGKAAVPMLDTLLSRMGRRSDLRGICCSNQLPKTRDSRFRYFEGGHPVPNEESFEAARTALSMLKKAKKDTLIFFLISGGGSPMFDLPIDPKIKFEDAVAFHQLLLDSGAPISEINTLRKHFSAVKGGRLAMAAPEAAKISLLLPDVPLRTLDALSSGPTSPDHSTVAEVRELLAKYDLPSKLPASVNAFFEQEDLPESPGNKGWRPPFFPRKAFHPRPITAASVLAGEEQAFRDSVFEVLLSSHDLVENARMLAEKEGYHVVIDNSCDDWDYTDAAKYLLERFHALRTVHPQLCLISGGEIKVQVPPTAGPGGRNQQFALVCALALKDYPNERLTVLSASSSGIDGNTRAAGAVVDPSTCERAIKFGFDPEKSLTTFNSGLLFVALGDTIETGGPTGQHLRDLRLLIADKE